MLRAISLYGYRVREHARSVAAHKEISRVFRYTPRLMEAYVKHFMLRQDESIHNSWMQGVFPLM